MEIRDKERGRIASMILRQGEKKLDAQLQLGISADQRGSILGSINAAITTALVGWAGYLFVSHSEATEVIIGLATSALLFLVATFCCLKAIKPSGLYVSGNLPRNWVHDGALEKSLVECLLTEAENYDEYISENRRQLKSSAKWIDRGLICASLAPVSGLILYFIWVICIS